MSDAFKHAGMAKQTGQCSVCPKPIKAGDVFYWNNMQGKGARACEECALKGGAPRAAEQSNGVSPDNSEVLKLLRELSADMQVVKRQLGISNEPEPKPLMQNPSPPFAVEDEIPF